MKTLTPAELVRAVSKAPHAWSVVRIRDRDNACLLAALREQERINADLRAERLAKIITACTAIALAGIALCTLLLS